MTAANPYLYSHLEVSRMLTGRGRRSLTQGAGALEPACVRQLQLSNPHGPSFRFVATHLDKSIWFLR